jgi:hypothetical protein
MPGISRVAAISFLFQGHLSGRLVLIPQKRSHSDVFTNNEY